MDPTVFDQLKSLPRLLDFPLTFFLAWVGLKVWREVKELVLRVDERHQAALRDIVDKTDRALDRVTSGMRSIREEVRGFRAEVYARIGRDPRRLVVLEPPEEPEAKEEAS